MLFGRGSLALLALVLIASSACDPPRPAVRRETAGQVERVTAAGSVPSAPPVLRAAVQAPGHTAAAEPSRDGWNTAQIDWQPYATGLARARAEHKPVCLVFHADWCPHCRNYSHVFEDPRIVARARDLIMVHVDTDHSPEIASRHQLDGTYVPRTYFLSPEGTPIPEIDARRTQYRYFFDEHDAGALLAAMESALRPG